MSRTFETHTRWKPSSSNRPCCCPASYMRIADAAPDGHVLAQVQEGVVRGLGQLVGPLLGLGFLLGSEGLRPGDFTEEKGELLAFSAILSFVYKDSTNFRAAHTDTSKARN